LAIGTCGFESCTNAVSSQPKRCVAFQTLELNRIVHWLVSGQTSAKRDIGNVSFCLSAAIARTIAAQRPGTTGTIGAMLLDSDVQQSAITAATGISR
jgi:hypothetical protein